MSPNISVHDPSTAINGNIGVLPSAPDRAPVPRYKRAARRLVESARRAALFHLGRGVEWLERIGLTEPPAVFREVLDQLTPEEWSLIGPPPGETVTCPECHTVWTSKAVVSSEGGVQ